MSYKDKEAQREYQREWMARRRSEWLVENGPCVDCGSWDELEVDHVDPTEKVTHRVWSWRQDKREAELAKCVARCSGCHLDRTNSQLQTRYCPVGHDKDVLGRDANGRGLGTCSECRREKDRRYRREGKKK